MTFPKIFTSQTFLYGAAGAVLFWAALPPVDFWPLAWIAPVPWIMLIRRNELAGPRPYLALWIVGFGFWLAALHWLRLPDPMTGFGWVALACYFAFYVPVFIGLSRIAVQQLRLPVILVAPLVWTGLELARTHLLTGMSMGDISHTQYRWTQLIQVADLAGQFAVCFTIVFVAACLTRMLPCDKPMQISSPIRHPRSTIHLTYWPLIPAIALLAAVLSYGYWRTANVVMRPGPRIALIQGSIDTKFGGDERTVRDDFYDHYFELSQKAVAEAAEKGKTIDLIVWPEIFFKEPLVSYDADAFDNFAFVKAGEKTGEACRLELQKWKNKNSEDFIETTRALNAPILLGLDAWHYSADGVKIYNSAAYVSKSGELLGRYDKMHLVPFGEYIPFADLFPWLYNGLTPLSGGMTPGKKPAAFDLEFSLPEGKKQTILFAPNICYETVLSREIRGQINTLQAQNREPDVLINLSNDGWYWGSSELDMLLACSVFRAVECRKPYVIAANTGFSASLDADGRVLLKGPRRDSATLLTETRLDSRRSFYLQYGDWPAGICLAGCIFFAAAGSWRGFRERRKRKMKE
jgi:apolipoprotein N-acyltransferase